LCVVVTGESSRLSSSLPRADRLAVAATSRAGYEYEVQYLLDAPGAGIGLLRARLAAIGDSVTVAAAGDDIWNVHVHVNEVGAAIEAGLAVGRAYQIAVTRFGDQVGGPAPTELIVLLADRGLRGLVADAGGRAIVADPSGTGDEVFDDVVTPQSARCLLLPADDSLVAITSLVATRARERGLDIAVVPCRSPMQVLAALAVHDGSRRADDDVIAMAEAAAATRFARVEVAVSSALTTIGPCRAGDVLGLIEGDVVEIAAEPVEVARLVLGRLLGVGGELLTVVVRTDWHAALDAAMRAWLSDRAPFVELVIYPDDDLDCIALFGME
jgi:dihydroxyacetone kinase-like predicted kinase